MRKILFACTIGLIFMSIGFAAFQKPSWDAPPEMKQKKNPVAPSDAVLREAKSIYADKCANCHGDTGKGDGSDAMMYDPGPADLTDAKRINKFTDGELFYKLTTGKKPMPSFEKRLTEEQRWEMVILVRSFSGSTGSTKFSSTDTPKPVPATNP
ncbi:MAG TPA: cytochrome c [Candidatus Acidoferrum sp.]|jgi:mono/diheme cytochrome c family protein